MKKIFSTIEKEINNILQSVGADYKVINEWRFEEASNTWSFLVEFSRLPWRGTSKKEKQILTVLIQTDIIVEKQKSKTEVTNFFTRLIYLRVKKEDGFELIDSFHCDMESEVKNTPHPVFHIQRANLVKSEKFAKYFKRLDLKEPICEKRECFFGGIRLPSLQMDFFSACLMVIADHCITGDNLGKFVDLCRLINNQKLSISDQNITLSGKGKSPIPRASESYVVDSKERPTPLFSKE